MNSRSVAVATATHSLAFPVNSIFSNVETLIPLGDGWFSYSIHY
jgi:hypothetical protein